MEAVGLIIIIWGAAIGIPWIFCLLFSNYVPPEERRQNLKHQRLKATNPNAPYPPPKPTPVWADNLLSVLGFMALLIFVVAPIVGVIVGLFSGNRQTFAVSLVSSVFLLVVISALKR